MSIFADFVLRHAPHPENAASDALQTVLRKSSAVMDGLVTFLAGVGVRDVGTPWVDREVAGEAGERPDFVVRDGDGHERCIVEAKFWAGLTDNQPIAYIRRMVAAPGTAVVFVCPPSRVDALWAELRLRCTQEGVVLTEAQLREGRAAATSLGPLLAVLPWQVLLTHLLQEAERQQDDAAATDLRQVVGLAERLDREAFAPLHSQALGPEVAQRTLWHFQTVDDLHDRLVEAGIATSEGRRTSTGAHFYGRMLRVDGVPFWMGVWWDAWASGPATPFWLQLLEGDTELWARGHAALDRLESQGRLSLSDYNGNVAVPLYPPVGREYESVLSGLVDMVRLVATELQSQPQGQRAAVPPLESDGAVEPAPEVLP